MLIGVRKRFVFVANTKAASTSIEHALAGQAEIMRGDDPARKHIPLSRIGSEYWFLFGRPEFPIDSFFRFGVMREPLSWIDSWFRYRRGNPVEAPLPPDMSFEEFWRARDWNIQRADGTRYLQSSLFTRPNGAPMADVIVPYERMADYLPEILDHLGVTDALPHKNISTVRETTAPVPDALLTEMRAFYAADYALYDRLDQINAVGMEKLRARSAGNHGVAP